MNTILEFKNKKTNEVIEIVQDEDHKTHLDSCYGFYYDDPKDVLKEVIPKADLKDWV